MRDYESHTLIEEHGFYDNNNPIPSHEHGGYSSGWR